MRAVALCIFAVSAWSACLAQPVAYLGVPGGAEWQAGEFAAAYQAAMQVDTAAAQLLASRAAADQAVYLELTAGAATGWLQLAEESAQRALELEPAGPQAAAATMALARAKGEVARYRGLLSSSRLPGELRALFERTLELDPDNGDALVAYGAWHLELTERGVGWLYGGDRSKVVPLFEQAIRAAPEQLNLRVEYAVALRTLGQEAAAREQLQIALGFEVETAADQFEHERAARLLAAP